MACRDSVDALGGAYDRENVLRILKDSRIGAFGALALIFALLLKLSLLVDLGSMAPVGFLLGQGLSRVLPVVQLGFQSYSRRDDPSSKSRDVARSGVPQAVIAGLWGVALLGLGLGLGLSITTLFSIVAAMVELGLSLGSISSVVPGD